MNIENLTLGELSLALAFIVGLFALLNRVGKPFLDFNLKMKELDKRQAEDKQRMDGLEEDTKQILLTVNALLSHSIDNNHNEELSKRKKELDAYLIQRG